MDQVFVLLCLLIYIAETLLLVFAMKIVTHSVSRVNIDMDWILFQWVSTTGNERERLGQIGWL